MRDNKKRHCLNGMRVMNVVPENRQERMVVWRKAECGEQGLPNTIFRQGIGEEESGKERPNEQKPLRQRVRWQ